MFGFKAKDNKAVQKVDIKTLLTDTSFALDQIDIVDSDVLLGELGLSRAQLLNKIEADDEVESCIDDLRAAMMSAEWRIWGDDVDDDTINPLYKNLRHHLDVFVELAITAKLNGYAVAEYQYYVEADGSLTLARVINKKGDLDSYQPRRDGTLLWRDHNGDEKLLDLQQKHLLLTCKASTLRPSGEIQVARLYPALQLRKMGFLYAGQFIKRYAQPYIIAKKASFDNNEQTWLQKIFNFLNGGGMIIGSDDEVTLHQLNGDGKAFKQLENMANARIQKLLLGRVKTSDLETGSRAAQQTEEQTRNDRISAYLALLGQAMQHALNALIAVNARYGNPITAPKGLWFEFEQAVTIDVKRAERDKKYLESGHVRFTKDYYTQILGFEEAHVEIVNPETQTPAALSLPSPGDIMLTDTGDTADNPPPLDSEQLAIMQPKIDAIMDALGASKDYADFDQRLADLAIGDQTLVNALVKQNAMAYIEGDSDA